MTIRKRRLPIGIQNFQEIREDGCYYVAKTAYVHRLLDEGKRYFLSRPRRSGKSLFLDTSKELFEGNELLCEGLDIHPYWDWSVRSPVLLLSFGSGYLERLDDLRAEVMDRLETLGEATDVPARYTTASARFQHLIIRTLRERTDQRVAVLIDEYDMPILNALVEPEVRVRQPGPSARPLSRHQRKRRRHSLQLHYGDQ